MSDILTLAVIAFTLKLFLIMLNRSAIIVRPKKAYIDWASSLDDVELLPAAEDERTVYLIPAYDTEEEAAGFLAQAWESIFEAELESWHLVEEDWPAERTLKMFREWFDVEMHSLIVDLCGDPLQDDGF